MEANGEILKFAAKYPCWLTVPVVLVLYLMTDRMKRGITESTFFLFACVEKISLISLNEGNMMCLTVHH